MSLSYLTVTISAMVVIGGFMLSGPIGQLYDQQQKISDLKAQVAQAKLDLTNMTTERSRWQDPVYIRAQARDRLYYVMPGEISYLVMGTDGLNLSDTSGTVGAKLAQERNIKNISKDILHTKNDWVAGIVQSVLRAGVEEPVKN
jgi:cell division protein FtsB